MSQDSDQNQEQSSVLDQLRIQASRVEELSRKIAQLEQDHNQCEYSKQQIAEQLAGYKEIMAEWVWFFNHSLDMLCVTGPDGRLKRVNNAMVEAYGVSREELCAMSFGAFVHEDDLQRARDALKDLQEGQDSVNLELRCLHKTKGWRWISWTCPANGGKVQDRYSIGRDITESKLTEAELLFRAQHDPLTTLANRSVFDQSLEQAIARTGRILMNHVALLVIDLDGFKAINDQFGHAAGDHLLKVLGTRFAESQRKSDMVFRIGGDEFAWMVESGSEVLLEPLAERIIELVRQPVEFGSHTLQVGCSIGASLCPEQATDAKTLFEQADAAMYKIKKAGKNGFMVYRA